MALKVFNLSGFRAGWIIGRVAPHDLSATLVVKGTFRLRTGLPATPLPEEEQEELNGDVNREDNRALSLVYSSDFALMKPNVDLLFIGAFHAPAGKPVAIGRVDVAVGEWSKSLAIIGNRVWRSRLLADGMSQPEPFTTMPIAYAKSVTAARAIPRTRPVSVFRRSWSRMVPEAAGFPTSSWPIASSQTLTSGFRRRGWDRSRKAFRRG